MARYSAVHLRPAYKYEPQSVSCSIARSPGESRSSRGADDLHVGPGRPSRGPRARSEAEDEGRHQTGVHCLAKSSVSSLHSQGCFAPVTIIPFYLFEPGVKQ